jgi:hypothetical protein
MQKDFDSEVAEDRTFKMGGEVFTYRIFHWTETVDMLDTKLDESLVINEDGSYSFRADTEWCLKEIPKFLDGPEEVKKFKSVIARKTDPVPRHQIAELYGFLRQKVQGLPTTPPSPTPSAGGGGTNGAESVAESPSTAATSKA